MHGRSRTHLPHPNAFCHVPGVKQMLLPGESSSGMGVRSPEEEFIHDALRLSLADVDGVWCAVLMTGDAGDDRDKKER